MDLSSRKIKKYIREGYDLNLISRIQSDIPDFKYDDRYWRQANGYYKIAHVPYDRYPEHGLPDFWMSDLMLVDNVISFMSLEHASNSEMSELASKAISNMLATQNTKAAQDADDKMRISSLLDYREKLGNNVPSKKIHTRFLLAANTLDQLVEREADLKQQLNQYSISSSDGMQDVEYHTAFIPASRLEDTPLRRKGQAASVWDLGAGYPFNHTNLMDTYGVYLGETRTGGVVNFDLLHEDRERKIPSMLIAGAGNGKMKLLGNLIDTYFAKGHTIFNIDLTGKLKELTEMQGGRYVKMSGTNNRNHINLMQIIATASSADGETTDQVQSFYAHRNKLRALAQILDPGLKNSDLNNLSSALNDFYEDRSLWNRNAEVMDQEDLTITNVIPEDYPTLSHWVERLNKLKEDKIAEGNEIDAASYDRLFNAFSGLLGDYRFLNATSQFEDFSNEQVVTFDLSGIQDTELLNIQLYQVLSIISSYAVANGRRVSEYFRRGIIGGDKSQRPHSIITINGTHKLFNYRYSESLNFLKDLIENVSSNYSAFIMEMSSLDNILLNANSTDAVDYVLATRAIFSMMTYRVFSQLGDLTIPRLADALQGEMTESELSSLKYLRDGDFFLNIASVKNLVFNHQLADNRSYGKYPYDEHVRYAFLP